jgi:hypothetical protein
MGVDVRAGWFRLCFVTVLLLILYTGVLGVSASDGVVIDLSVKPVFSKVEGVILPGDVVRVTVSVRSTGFSGDSVRVDYVVVCGGDSGVFVVGRGGVDVVLDGGLGSASFNVEVPWCGSLTVEAAPLGLAVEPSRVTVGIGPEVALRLVEPRDPFLGERREGGYIIVRVLTRTNVDGGYGVLVVRDETLGLTLLERRIEVVDGRVHEVYIRLPENPVRLGVFKEWSMLHVISIRLVSESGDSYPDNNVVNLYAVILADDIWRIPWALSVAAGFIVALVVLAYMSRRLYT